VVERQEADEDDERPVSGWSTAAGSLTYGSARHEVAASSWKFDRELSAHSRLRAALARAHAVSRSGVIEGYLRERVARWGRDGAIRAEYAELAEREPSRLRGPRWPRDLAVPSSAPGRPMSADHAGRRALLDRLVSRSSTRWIGSPARPGRPGRPHRADRSRSRVGAT